MVLFLFILGNEIEDEGTKEIAKPLKIKKNLTPFVLRSTYCDVALEVAKSLKKVPLRFKDVKVSLVSKDLAISFAPSIPMFLAIMNKKSTAKIQRC